MMTLIDEENEMNNEVNMENIIFPTIAIKHLLSFLPCIYIAACANGNLSKMSCQARQGKTSKNVVLGLEFLLENCEEKKAVFVFILVLVFVFVSYHISHHLRLRFRLLSCKLFMRRQRQRQDNLANGEWRASARIDFRLASLDAHCMAWPGNIF
jgi:hypothetical protein